MQSRTVSLIEVCLNIGSGFIIAWITNILVLPWFGFEITASQSFWVTVIFTSVSLVRSYIWRRIFNRWAIAQLRRV